MTASPRSTTRTVSPVAGVKRPAPAPSLLPAFEPYSSSPPLPRPTKRVACDSSATSSPTKTHVTRCLDHNVKYPTPVPTSSTGLMSSSPPARPMASAGSTTRRPGIQRSMSTLSERAPLASVPTVILDATGEPTMMGRSTKSSTYQLSANKLISRVHLRAAYVPADPPAPARVELMCAGWNGLRVHCEGRAWELAKDDVFKSESQGADVMVDVQDTRVLIRWPKIPHRVTTPETESDPDGENGLGLRSRSGLARRSPLSSPLRQHAQMQSPVSPSPARPPLYASPLPQNLEPSNGNGDGSDPAPIQVYEDDGSDREAPVGLTQPTQSTQQLTQPLGTNLGTPAGQLQEFFDQDEENDPIITSFGPFGDNLLPRMASFRAGATPERRKRRASGSLDDRPQVELSKQPLDLPVPHSSPELIANHVVNQLAFSRLSSTPLSSILSMLPSELRPQNETSQDLLSTETLRTILADVPCIGQVTRAGKDAAGKPLESEYYYISDKDTDEGRRDAVVEGLRKPGLRECRKQHKQYYWRKPK